MADENAPKPGEDVAGSASSDLAQPEPAGASAEPAGTAAPSPEQRTPDPGADADAARLAQLSAENAELKDRLLRALAEAENVRRRAERDRKDAETYAGTRLARDLLQVCDNLDRALGHVDEALRSQAQGFIEGVELTQRELLNAFAKHKIEKVSPDTGEKFDPNLHQAMFEAPVPGAVPGTVIEVLQAGFTIAGRLLRPALVGIARAAPQAPAGVDAPSETAAKE